MIEWLSEVDWGYHAFSITVWLIFFWFAVWVPERRLKAKINVLTEALNGLSRPGVQGTVEEVNVRGGWLPWKRPRATISYSTVVWQGYGPHEGEIWDVECEERKENTEVGY